ncbi:uncharacterized protein LOC133174266 isoform X2 [Saccostrea echinata]|uniref:uncharacterized protein LOC133174266 isoform X2 n=1 Tax=Saccostrea echinata TaxID=191078 RepID=UPI002A8225C8|nr:uncharacterized protein LOC133174266 isoform X2 [Saccostrea echinata]
MFLKFKVTIGIMMMNTCMNILLLVLDGLTINKCLNVEELEDPISDLRKKYQGLGVQLSFTEKKNTLKAIIITGGFSICNSIAVIVTFVVMTICLVKYKAQNIQLALVIMIGITGGISLILGVPKAVYTHNIGREADLTQVKLNETDMLEKLETLYTSDIISPLRNTTSDRWNLFFLENKCCAVKPVTSTTNDFDKTPWCTTSGSCQQTNSQIPKACCKNVTVDNYTSAEARCHANVIPGTYHEEFVSGGTSLLTILVIHLWKLSES